MARYQIEWLPSDAIEPLDEDQPETEDEVEKVVELDTADQSEAAEDWTGAIGKLLGELGFGDDSVSEVICEISPAGRWSVAAPGGRRAALVPVPQPSIEIDVEIEEDAPSLMSSILGPEASLTPASAELPSPAPSEAGRSLDGLLAVVPAESAAVLIHQPGSRQLAFIAARGPRAQAVQGMRIPEDAGVAGLVLASGTTIAIHEQAGGGHYTEVDETVGYRTRSLLAVPVTWNNRVVGVLELLNISGGAFEPWHRALALETATRLGERVGPGAPSA